MSSHQTTRNLLAALAKRLRAVCIAFTLGVVVGPFMVRQLLAMLPVLIPLCFAVIVLRLMILRLLR
jgi:hypothetical protein